jgi:hypothetical protein
MPGSALVSGRWLSDSATADAPVYSDSTKLGARAREAGAARIEVDQPSTSAHKGLGYAVSGLTPTAQFYYFSA